MKKKELYEYSITQLEAVGIEEAKTDTLLLLADICGINRNDLLMHGDETVDADMEETFFHALTQRCKRIPVQYITGKQNFMGLDFYVNEHVLIPRMDTEILVEEVLKDMHDGFRILDMCTGSGCILLSVLKYSNDCEGVGVDISKDALEVAGKNCAALGLQADFIESDLFEAVEGRFDIIISNPPYIKSDVIPTLMEEVREHEPLLALDGKEDGCFFYKKIIEESPNYLNSGGMLFFEIGYDQGEAVSNMMTEHGFKDVKVIKDYAGLDRVVSGSLYGG